MQNERTDKIYFANLDAIRFIAATMVFIGHSKKNIISHLPLENIYFKKIFTVISGANIGVSIFFVLSGFLITYLLISEFELNSGVDIKKFYMRRLLRIWPLYFAVVAFSFIIYPCIKTFIGVNNPLPSNIIYHLSFLSNFDVINIRDNYPGNDALSQNITWSVSVEEQFYLFWPLIFTFLPKRYWLSAILLTILGSILFQVLNYNNSSILYFHTISALAALGIGALFAYLSKTYAEFKSFFEKSATKTHLIFFSISFALLLWRDDLFFGFAHGYALSGFFVLPSFALIICAQAFTKSSSLLNLKNFTFANRWGKYTYGIYLLHPIVLTLVDVFLRIAHISATNAVNSFLIFLASFILTLFLSKCSYVYFESKFLKLKKGFTVIKSYE